MQTRAALLKVVPGKWEVETVELDPPRDHEVLVRIVAAGLCHSDDHFATGDITVGHLPSAVATRRPGSSKPSGLECAA